MNVGQLSDAVVRELEAGHRHLLLDLNEITSRSFPGPALGTSEPASRHVCNSALLHRR
ncbi:hypothetical protein [Streptomyces flavofungini]|uniref:hypothetical protein n=1 Tax=Streptomyces flavofungini TaxID=68200 RepID=UPI0025B07196|nr:hypothetical protein [Streptomyces flavofungini]WJV45373.1 hypothetical protein QUY26_07370 [Streptomyces flavofungini]